MKQIMVRIENKSDSFTGHKNCLNVYKELQQVSIIQEINEQQIPKTFTFDSVYDTDA